MSKLIDRRMSYRQHAAVGECRIRLFSAKGGYIGLATDLGGLSVTNAYEAVATQVYKTIRTAHPMRPSDLELVGHRPATGNHPEYFVLHPLTWDAARGAYTITSDDWQHPTRDEVVAMCGEDIG